jgi:antirestriction protein ArdC
MSKVYTYVTEKIIEQLGKGVMPWRKPWNGVPAMNYITRKPYRGINALMLDSGEYLTFKQIQELGGRLKKGSKGEMVVFYKVTEVEEDEETKRSFVLRYYNVFNIKNVEGVESKVESFNNSPIGDAEKIIQGYAKKPKIVHDDQNRAYYSPFYDLINVPEIKHFKQVEEYYSTAFHEIVHSTGHKKRLKRFEDDIPNVAFGSKSYSKEELIAELGSAMLCNMCGIDNTLENSASYIKGWLKVLQDDKKFVVQASAHAQKAVDHILGISYNEIN